VTAAEITFFWLAVVWRRKDAWALLRTWRDSRFVRFGLPFTIVMALMYGMAFANLGIIARQRAVILPFMLLLVSIRHRILSPDEDAALTPSSAARITA
jgi:hypothetical protein